MKILYILTGSSVVDESENMHSGTGRIHRLIVGPMSLYESGESNGKIQTNFKKIQYQHIIHM